MRTNDAARGEGEVAPARVTSAMVALAWCVLHCPDDDESAKVLARLILDGEPAEP